MSGSKKNGVAFDEVYRIAKRRSERIIALGDGTYGLFTDGRRLASEPGTTLANLKHYLLLPARVRRKVQWHHGQPIWEDEVLDRVIAQRVAS